MALKSFGLPALCAVFLAGCSALGGSGAGAMLSMLKPKGPQTSAFDMPRAELEKAGVPVMVLASDRFGYEDFVAPRDRRGAVVNWGSADGLLVTLRDGVLIETRGLGGDLMSSAMPGAGQIAGSGSYRRSYFFVGPEDRSDRIDFTCTPRTAGTETLAVFGLGYPTRHVIETCESDAGVIKNEYWLQGSTIRKSREWVSPTLQYIELTRVID